MGEENEIKKSCSLRKKKRAKSFFQWTKGEELILLKKLVEFSTHNLTHEQFYPFVRNGLLAEVSKIQIFDKIQQLKKKYLEILGSTKRMQFHLESDEAFELSKQLWGETETESASTSKAKALDVSNIDYFEEFLESHGLELDLLTPSCLEATKKEVDELFCLQNHNFLIKANLKAQLGQLKHHIMQIRFENHNRV